MVEGLCCLSETLVQAPQAGFYMIQLSPPITKISFQASLAKNHAAPEKLQHELKKRSGSSHYAEGVHLI